MTDFIAEGARAPLPFAELRTSGLLWLINRVVFHPRGFALGLHHDHAGNPYGWSLLGDGTEVWAFESDEDTKFEAAQAFLRRHTKPLARRRAAVPARHRAAVLLRHWPGLPRVPDRAVLGMPG